MIDNACSYQSAITFVKSDLEGNILSAQYSEEEMIPPPAPLRRLGTIGGIQSFGQSFGQKTFASLTSLFRPNSPSSSTKPTTKPVHKEELSGVFHMVGKDLTVLKGQKEAIERVLARSQKTERGQSKGKSLRSEPTGPPFDLNIVPTLVSFFTQIM
jgi:hypothetical protein